MFSSKLVNMQQDGFVAGFLQASLSEANRQIKSAMNAIPEHLRDKFKSQIRANRNGYCWFVVLK